MPQSRSLWVYAAQLALTLTFKESPLDIMQHFAEVRLVMYEKCLHSGAEHAVRVRGMILIPQASGP